MYNWSLYALFCYKYGVYAFVPILLFFRVTLLAAKTLLVVAIFTKLL